MIRRMQAVLLPSLLLLSCDPGWSFGSEITVEGDISRACVTGALNSTRELGKQKEWADSSSVEVAHHGRQGFVKFGRGQVTVGWSGLGAAPSEDEAAHLRRIADEVRSRIQASCNLKETARKTFCRADGTSAEFCE